MMHEERIKMMENGLVEEDLDLINTRSTFKHGMKHDWTTLIFYPVIFWYFLLFVGYLAFTLFSILLIKTQVSHFSYYATLLGIIATATFVVTVKVLPFFAKNRSWFFIGGAFLALMWTGIFMRQVSQVSLVSVKKTLMNSVAKTEKDVADDTKNCYKDTNAVRIDTLIGEKVIIR
ncbi:MAG: hypothetical protein JNL74_06415 [Fibrobacteres bacterium]|nr:hypothetical protein [Fibrobacterota bacterium]